MLEFTRICFLYVLCEPDGEVRYVGKTVDPVVRLKWHLTSVRYKGCVLGRWLKALAERNLQPVFKIIKVVPLEESIKAEGDAISYYKKKNARLLNKQKMA
jgi:GIY-YIG catalytic domain